jgi:hypothetical protein
MRQDDPPQHVLCPDCGAEATRLPDGALYCPREHTVVREFAGRPDRGRARDPDPEHPGPPSPEQVAREYGLFNILLFVFVVVGLVAAAVAIVLVF